MVYGNSSFFGYMWHVVHNRENLQLRFLQEVAVFPEWQLGPRFFCLFCALYRTWTYKSDTLKYTTNYLKISSGSYGFS